MNDINAALTGRSEDKWIEFVANEFDARKCGAARPGRSSRNRAAGCVTQIEVHASYLWLFAGALVAWLVS